MTEGNGAGGWLPRSITETRRGLASASALMCLSIVVGLVAAARRSSATRAEAGRIWAGGMRGRAKVVDISTKGGRVNDNPTIDFELDVTPEGQSTYRAQAVEFRVHCDTARIEKSLGLLASQGVAAASAAPIAG